MSPRVTAIIVVQDGARDAAHLRATLAALEKQTRRPEHVVAVAMASPPAVMDLLAASLVNQVVSIREVTTFGQAVASGIAALGAIESSDPEREAYWLLAQDTAPEPEALARLVGALEVSPSVGVVGPKLVDWDAGETIIAYGESMTRLGTSVALVENELDQGQHDTVSDVLGVSAPALLVRRRVWEEVGGFDPALERADEGLDFCTRVRLADHRVSLEAQARVRWAGDGIAGPARSRKGAVVRRQAGLARAAQLHRRLVYANPVVLWLHWLSLVPLALVRGIWRLISKQPELIAPETGAALRTAFSPGRVTRGRARLQRAKRVGWGQLAELRIPHAEVRRRNRLRKEAGTGNHVIARSELRFISGGGGWLVAGAAVLSLTLFFRFVDAAALAGGALLPLSSTVSELWGNTGFAWRDLGLGFIGASDPFSSVLAVLGTITFWNPSSAIVGLYLFALPLAALGGWFAATRLTERSGYRLLAGALWTLSPSLLGSLAAGEIAAVIVHLTLPWLFYTITVYRRSWAAAAVASMLTAAILASAPSLIGAFLVGWIILAVTAGRLLPRVIWLAIPTLTLFAPLIWQQGVRSGNWWALLADPGAAVAGAEATAGWRIALGIPGYHSSGWPGLIESLGFGGIAADWLLPVLMAPLAILAFGALFYRGSLRAFALLGIAALGLASAVAAGQIHVVLSGSSALPIWPGPAMSLYALGLIGAGIVGLDAVRRAGIVPAIVVGVTAAMVAGPLIVAFPAGTTPIHATDGRTLPAYVTAAAGEDPHQGTLVLRPEGQNAISARIVRGAGLTLDSRSTIVNTRTEISPNDERLAELSGNLISASGLDIATYLAELRVRFVLLAPPSSVLDAEAIAGSNQTTSRANSALDSDASLGRIGPTDQGVLWRFDGEIPAADPAPFTWATPVVGFGTGAVFLIALLLSVPTSASRRLAEMSPRTIGGERAVTARGRRAASRRNGREPGSARRARLRAERQAEAEATASVAAELEAEVPLGEHEVPAPPPAEGTDPSWPVDSTAEPSAVLGSTVPGAPEYLEPAEPVSPESGSIKNGPGIAEEPPATGSEEQK